MYIYLDSNTIFQKQLTAAQLNLPYQDGYLTAYVKSIK